MLLVAAALVLPVVPAAADSGTFRDPEEQPFCESPDPCPDDDYMDFRRLTFGHGDSGRTLRHGFYTEKRWKTRRLGGRHGTTIDITFNTDRDQRGERSIEIRRKDGELQARMFRGRYLLKPIPGDIRVWRPDRRSVKVAFAPRLLGERVRRYRWYVVWYDRGLACPGSCGNDFAPNKGWYEHRL